MNSKKYDGVNYPVRGITDLKDLLFSGVEMYGDSPAYLVKDKERGVFVPISYTQVGHDIRSLGTGLLDLGLADQKIGVIGENRYSWVLSYFAVVAGVGVIVPLDKNLPEGELRGLIDRSGMKAVIFSDKERKKIEPLIGGNTSIEKFISMDQKEHADGILSLKKLIEEGGRLIDAGDDRYMERKIDPDRMAALLFTSGTTGLAKGVMLSHRNIANNVLQLSAYFHIPEPGIVLNILPSHHVYAMTCDYWTTFYQGKTIAICEGLKYIQKNMNEVHANVMLGVPLVFDKLYKGMLRTAAKTGEDRKLRRALDMSKKMKLYRNQGLVRKMFASVHDAFGGDMKAFIVGGAAADPYIIEEFEAMGISMIQGYGMSECAPIIALNRDRYRKAASVGQIVRGARVKLIDQDEDGVGEIIVKSPSVMLGYYENEEATQEALRDGWLHTGDLGRFDSDGFLYLTGRSKTVIVTKGGKNIFPEEVEEVLMKNDLIREVVVHGVDDERTGNVMITADIFPNYELLRARHGEMSRSEIYHFYKALVNEMNELMPPYKQVKRVTVRDREFIKTTTGKIKRYGNRLSGPELANADSGAVDYHDLKLIEQRRAKEFVDEIKSSDDPCYLHKDIRPVTDVRDLIADSSVRFRERTAFLERMKPGGEYVRISYQQAASDIDGLGTALMNRGFYKTVTALLGRNCYQNQISFLAVSSGCGTVVPLDPGLLRETLEEQIRRAGVKALIYDEKYEETVRAILKDGNTDIRTLIAYGPEDEAASEAGSGSGPGTAAAVSAVAASEAGPDVDAGICFNSVAGEYGAKEKTGEIIAGVNMNHGIKSGGTPGRTGAASGTMPEAGPSPETAGTYPAAGLNDAAGFDIADSGAAREPGSGSGPGTAAAAEYSWRELVEDGKARIARGDRQFLDAEVRASDVCAVFFTSGRTGKAKAVPVTQKCLVTDIMAASALVSYKEDDAVFSGIAPGNIYQICMGLLMPLYKGASVTDFDSIITLEKDMNTVSPTVLLLEPRILQELCGNLRSDITGDSGGGKRRGKSAKEKFSQKKRMNEFKGYEKHLVKRLGGRIRLIITGGDVIDPAELSFLSGLGVPAIQGYGMCETTAVCAMNPDDVKLADPESCGKVLPGVLMKASGSGYNGVGEILVKGPTVMQGYLDDPEKTAEVLENGWFHTGDTGRVSENGFLYLTGKKGENNDGTDLSETDN